MSRVTILIPTYNEEQALPATLAAAVGFSKFHLLRTFKAATGLTPWRYQVQLRLASARALLRDGVPASQVAVICGFFDQSHFTRLFRASFGITPAAFQSAYKRL